MNYSKYPEKIWNFIDEQLKKLPKGMKYEDKLAKLVSDTLYRRDWAKADENYADVTLQNKILDCLRELQSDAKEF